MEMLKAHLKVKQTKESRKQEAHTLLRKVQLMQRPSQSESGGGPNFTEPNLAQQTFQAFEKYFPSVRLFSWP